ncbi:MAG: tyrosine-type recombinase/integrase [Bryobacteraceae bacterium]
MPALADELRTHLNGRSSGFLLKATATRGIRHGTVQSVVTDCARAAGIEKRVYPHLLRHSIATILLDSGLVPIDQVQKFLGHLNVSTTQIYAETSLRGLGENYVRALGRVKK